ncbi:MAG: F0F1 ATP synthase subunit A [Kiritimatiellia bacterium]
MHEWPRYVLIRLPPVLGIDLSITNEVVLLWLAALITCVTLIMAYRRTSLIPRGMFQNFFEALAEFIDKEVVREAVGEKGRKWAPFLLGLFFYILFCDLLGMLPDPIHFRAATANISTTAGLALTVVSLTVFISIREHGLRGFLRKFAARDVPRWLLVLLVPIEVVSWMARPFSLAIRLFANMLAGHTLIFLFVSMQVTLMWLLKPLPLIGAVAMSCFELFVCFIQAFIFTILAGFYIGEAIEGH